METGAYGADGASERDGGVRIAEFMEVAKHDGFAVANRQRNDRAAQRLEMTTMVEVADRVDVDGQLRGIRLRLIVQRQRPPDRASPPRMVARDAEQPELRGGLAWPIARCAADDGDERFVDDVPGGGGRAAHVRGKAAHAGAVAAVEFRERVAVARGNLRDQQVVWYFGHIPIQPGRGKSSRRIPAYTDSGFDSLGSRRTVLSRPMAFKSAALKP